MRAIATTVVRESIRGKQRTGFIYDVDLEARTVARRLPVPDPNFPESDDNPRGGVRGGRGVAVTSRGIVVANYDTLSVYDDEWTLLDSITHPLFVGLHEIDWDGSHIWMAATGIDALLRTTLDGTVEAAWDPHAAPDFMQFDLRRRPDPLDGSVDYRVREAPLIDQCHLNGVTRRNGTTIVNCGLVRKRKSLAARTLRHLRRPPSRKEHQGSGRRNSGRSLVVQVDHGLPARVLVELADHDFPTHNGQLLDDGRVIVNDSTENTLRVFAVESPPKEILAARVPGTWLRGLEPIAPNRVVVGTAPASLVIVDVTTGSLEGAVQLSDDPNEAVHGLTLCPPRDERL